MAGVNYIAPGTYKKSGHTTFSAASATKEDVGCFEFDGESALVSATRQLPAAPIGAVQVISGMFAIVGPDSGNLTGATMIFGVCPSHARRFGQASEYVLSGAYAGIYPRTYTGTTYANTSPTPNVNFQWSDTWWPRLTDAGAYTTNGSGYAAAIPRANQDFSDGINATHFNMRWIMITIRIQRTSTTAASFRYNHGYFFVPKWATEHVAWDHVGDNTYQPRYAGRRPQMVAQGGLPANDTSSLGSFTTENVDFNFLNIAWACTNSGARLLVRDLNVGWGRDGATGWIP